MDLKKFESSATVCCHKEKPYVVGRNSTHNVAVYERTEQAKHRDGTPDIYNEFQLTLVKNIDGDIWALEKDLRRVIKATHQLDKVQSSVCELTGKITFLGFYRYCIRDFLVSHGF